MAPRFPLYIDLYDNNCVIFGGGNQAAVRAEVLLNFGAKVTVISPNLCPELKKMDTAGLIRYLPRRYYRGDCSSGYLCIAATNDDAINISIHVNVTNPSAFGTFMFPTVTSNRDVTVSVTSNSDPEQAAEICVKLAKSLDSIIKRNDKK